MEEKNDLTNMTDTDLIIPVDDAITEFRHHLLSHPRTILSARFGDGKTYFVSKFIENADVQQKFKFLRIFPINYQVLENKDIFEIVKRDILLQLIYNEMIPAEYDISDGLLLPYYIQNNGVGLVEDLISYLPSLTACNESIGKVALLASGAVSLFNKIKDKFDKYKQENSYAEAIIKFLSETDKNYLIEEDLITCIIKDCINKYRNENAGKRVALIFEDMDRIDPAHLFRIMNVLSAQMDYSYKYGIDSNSNSCSLNKFGVDNIVLILDYDNLEKLFYHFYGKDANFNGYIHKFTSSSIFTYSLKAQQYNYVVEKIAKDTMFRMPFIKDLFHEDIFKDYSLRELNNAIDNTESQIKDIVTFDSSNGSVNLPLGPLKMFVFLRRLGQSDDQIKEIYYKSLRLNGDDFLYNAGGYYLKARHSLIKNDFYIVARNNYYRHIIIDNVRSDGRVSLSEVRHFEPVRDIDSEEILWNYLIGLIAK